jgi:hypothetical protein
VALRNFCLMSGGGFEVTVAVAGEDIDWGELTDDDSCSSEDEAADELFDDSGDDSPLSLTPRSDEIDDEWYLLLVDGVTVAVCAVFPRCC